VQNIRYGEWGQLGGPVRDCSSNDQVISEVILEVMSDVISEVILAQQPAWGEENHQKSTKSRDT